MTAALSAKRMNILQLPRLYSDQVALGNVTYQRSLVMDLCAGVHSLWLGGFPRGFQAQVGSSLNTAVLDLDSRRWYNCPFLKLQPASQGSLPRVARQKAPVENLARLCHLSEVLDDLNLQHAYRRIFWNERHGKLHFPMCLHVTQCRLVRYAFLLQCLSMRAVHAMDRLSFM
jgi:hypothetical protein